jgi:hypothetical protein
MEKKVRNIINTYCGQSFEYYPNKYLEVMGSGKNTLHIPNPITTLRKVTSDPGTNDETVLHDYSDATLNHIEKIREPHSFGSSYYLQFRKSVLDSVNVLLLVNRFDKQSIYRVEGDFGWQFVPNNIEQAADLLLVDMMNDDSEFRRHGIQRVEMDTIRYEINTTNFFETTGNIDADVLLMDYTLFVMDYVV